MLDNKGVSMIELMIVMAVISILAGLAVPAVIDWMPNYRLKSAARDLYSNIQKARMLAIKTNKEHAIFFDPANKRYQLLGDPGPDSAWGTGDDTNDRPGPDEIYGNGDDIPEQPPAFLTNYGSGIDFGHGSATTNATQGGGAFEADDVSYTNNIVVLNPTGMLGSLGGYVYLSNNINNCYAVGTPTTVGTIVLKKWNDPINDWK
jgi:type IV fimbrial biogenesis protein FimT